LDFKHLHFLIESLSDHILTFPGYGFCSRFMPLQIASQRPDKIRIVMGELLMHQDQVAGLEPSAGFT
jgi:hypothetical protein